MRIPASLLALLTATTALGGEEAELLTLEAAKTLARQNNLDIQIARERLGQAANLSRRAWAGILPLISATAGYSRNKAIELELFDLSSIPPEQRELVTAIFGSPSDGPQYIVPPDQWNAAVSFTWPLLSGPALTGIANAYDAVKLAEITYEQTETALLFATSLAYFNLVNAKQQVDIRQRALDNARAHLRLSEAKVAVGEATRVTALRSEVEVAAAEQELIGATNSARLAERALATLVGYVKPDGSARPIEVTPASTRATFSPAPTQTGTT
jgi:outer membrane protein TolC